MLSALPATATTSGVRVSCSPRSIAGGGQHHQQRRGPEEGDPQVRRRRACDGGVGAEETDQLLGEEHPGHGDQRADQHRQPDPVDALGECAPEVAGPEQAGHRGGGAVGEEDAEPDRGLEHDRRYAQPGQRLGAEVADDGGVGEQEERLGDEGEEGRDRQAHDLAVVGVGEGHPNRLDPQ